MKKKLLALTLVGLLAVTAACGGGTTGSNTPAPSAEAAGDTEDAAAEKEETPASEAPAEQTEAPAPAADGEKPYIAVVSKGFQHQFWQVVNKGAQAAADELGVEITFEGPPTESDIAIQVDMLNAALNKKPAAIALAALDTEAVTEQLNACKASGIPVVGFDSGVPNAPEGTIYATASTDNAAAAALAAQMLMENADFKAALDAATAAAPIKVGVISQDATSESIISRTAGFVDELVNLVGADKVQVLGHDKYKKDATDPVLIINVNVTATTQAADQKAIAEGMLTAGDLIAIYGSNENAAGGILAASNDGADFADGAKYDKIIAIGFDAGKVQRNAVQQGWFYGSITQDPYQIGYQAVKLAVDAVNGTPAASPIVDTGAKWYNSENLSDPSISELVYE